MKKIFEPASASCVPLQGTYICRSMRSASWYLYVCARLQLSKPDVISHIMIFSRGANEFHSFWICRRLQCAGHVDVRQAPYRDIFKSGNSLAHAYKKALDASSYSWYLSDGA